MCTSTAVLAIKMPDKPPMTNMLTNAIALSIGVVKRMLPPQSVPSQLNVLMADGTAINIVDSAKADDISVAEVYAKKGAKVVDLDDATLAKWRAIAKPVWKDYSDKNANCAKLLALAEKLL